MHDAARVFAPILLMIPGSWRASEEKKWHDNKLFPLNRRYPIALVEGENEFSFIRQALTYYKNCRELDES